ncbi:hypothetical protein SAMN04488074_102400 [Lentzea albidocapillata subsp. violacea]|uniref:DUF2269 domain-containing protein n=1 Tax=Lentzea albidocapillata subsp. violacea TaxID=128104 RepID=A0A1G8UT10_9PSEU|nr:hypothetical protein [Lentzea albidocapillata]SDJ56938.1 hypothetical protein SAMN04488074_102400 [Lentzea albidocapillata subsp. violacea]
MTTTRKLSGRARKAVLLVHVLSAAAWLGIDLALGILIVVALSTEDTGTAGVAIQAVDLFAIWPMFGASVVCMISGAVLGLGSKYGLVRYWWVAIKFVLNAGMSLLIAFSLRPGVAEAAGIGRRMLAGDPAAVIPPDVLYPVVVAPTLLLFAYFLSVFKPWGRIRRPAEPVKGRRDLVGAV